MIAHRERELSRGNLGKIRKVVNDILSQNLFQFDSKNPNLPLMVPSYSTDEVMEALDSMLTTRVSMGEKVFKFEDEYGRYIGRKHAVMVNSGSSANLLALSAIRNPMICKEAGREFEAVIPAVTWSTTMFPVSNCGGTPVLVDVDSRTFDLTPESLASGLSTKTRVAIPVHLLGNPCDMPAILKILSERPELRIVEDACEAHGAEVNGKKVGSFGDAATFSFYFSHHMTTIEGGIMVTNDAELAEVARMLRAHGWIRELRQKRRFANGYPEIDSRFLFVNTGFNLRPTEIQGAFGLHQLKKLEHVIASRRSNAEYLDRRLRRYSQFIRLQQERKRTRHVWFGYPITITEDAPFSRKDLVQHLESGGIQTRPIMAGNLAEQPAARLIKHRTVSNLRQARRIMRNSFFFGNHQFLTREALDYIISRFEDFFATYS